MPTHDDFDPAQTLPRFLAESAGQENDHAPDRAAPPSRFSKVGILIVATAAIGVAVLAVGYREALFADAPASLADTSPAQPVPPIQAAADASAAIAPATDAQAAPSTPTEAPARTETAASEPAGTDQAEGSETLFKQFQAWAAEQDAQPKPDAPARVAQTAPAPPPAAENVRPTYRFAQKRRQVRAVRNARAEIRTQNLRRQVRRTQSERTARPAVAVQDTRAQEQPVQNGQTSPFVFGARN